MEAARFLSAQRLLVDLRADGCIVTVESERLLVEGILTSERQVAIIAHKAELVELLTAGEPQPAPPAPAVPAETAPGLGSWAALGRKPPSNPLGLPHGQVVAGVAIATLEMQRWVALRNDAQRDGRKFDLSPPRYWYPPGTR